MERENDSLRTEFSFSTFLHTLLCQGNPLDAIEGNNGSDHYVNSCKFEICAFLCVRMLECVPAVHFTEQSN